MQIKIVLARDGGELGNWIGGADAGGADIGDDARWLKTGGNVVRDQLAQGVRIGAAIRAFDRDAHQIVAADAGEPDGAIDRGVRFR